MKIAASLDGNAPLGKTNCYFAFVEVNNHIFYKSKFYKLDDTAQ